jgi:hypothetical protein
MKAILRAVLAAALSGVVVGYLLNRRLTDGRIARALYPRMF